MKGSGLHVYIPTLIYLLASHITTIDDTLFWSVFFPADVVSGEQAQRFTDRMLEIILKCSVDEIQKSELGE